MTTKVILPKGGMGIAEAEILRWLKAEGDRVTQGEVIVETETAKATEELEAPVSGVLSKILVPEGEVVEVTTVLAEIEEGA